MLPREIDLPQESYSAMIVLNDEKIADLTPTFDGKVLKFTLEKGLKKYESVILDMKLPRDVITQTKFGKELVLMWKNNGFLFIPFLLFLFLFPQEIGRYIS